MGDLLRTVGDVAPTWLIAVWSAPWWLRAMLIAVKEWEVYRAERR